MAVNKQQNDEWCTSYYLDVFVRCFGAERTQKALYLPSKSLAAGCIYAVRYYQAAGKYDKNPEIGAQIFFCDSYGDPSHTGMVIGYDNTYVYTIEGNTSGGSTVISNGGGVCRKSYYRSYSRIHGYGHPDWAYLDQAYTEGWQKSNGKWWYRYTDGSWPKSEWKQIDGYWYYFDAEGYIVTDKVWTYNGYVYTADSDGHVTSAPVAESDTQQEIPAQETTAPQQPETPKEEFSVAKTYKNGSTEEPVFADTTLKLKTGSLNPWEQCECLAVVNGRYLVKYIVDGTTSYKTGFVEYDGGVK